MVNILDYIKDQEPEIYRRSRYRIIEISSKLAERQSERQDVRQVSQRHQCVEIINQSIFTWDQQVPEACFIIAMEVIVRVDSRGDFTLVKDPNLPYYRTISLMI